MVTKYVPWFKRINFAPMKTFHVKLSKYQYARLISESNHVHESAEQIIREGLAMYFRDQPHKRTNK